MRISDWSSDVCSSDLGEFLERVIAILGRRRVGAAPAAQRVDRSVEGFGGRARSLERLARRGVERQRQRNQKPPAGDVAVAILLRVLLGGIETTPRIVVEDPRRALEETGVGERVDS